MRIWNLNTLSELDSPVVLTFKSRPKHRGVSGSSSIRAGFPVAIAAAVLSAAFLLPYPSVSGTAISLVPEDVNIAYSLPRVQPPLEDVFKNRFKGSWSIQDEEKALAAMAGTHSKKPAEFDESESVEVALANQQESLNLDVPRLPKNEVINIVRKRRSV